MSRDQRAAVLRLFSLALLLAGLVDLSEARLARQGPAVREEEEVAFPRIVNGNLTSDYPTVGALVTPAEESIAITICSGTMIGCDTFLTAAHCVCSSSGALCQAGAAAPEPEDYLVFLQHAGFFSVQSIAVHPDYDFPTADVAVLKLSQPLSAIPPTKINDVASPPAGSIGEIVGFGRSGGSGFDYSLKRAGLVETVSCGVPELVCWEYLSPVGPPGQDSNTCNGDSGGPLFWNSGSGDVIAGITSGGNNGDCLTDDFSFDTNVFQYHSYIEDKGGPDLAHTSCGVGPQIGDPDASVLSFTGQLSPATPSHTHSIEVPPGTVSLRVAMNASEQAADFDLYVKAGSPATPTDFDCKADGASQLGYCEFTDPATTTWYARVERYSGSVPYQVTATIIGGGCVPQTEGEPCDDGNVCTQGETCQSSQCVGAPALDGTACDDDRACTSNDACVAGACVGETVPVTGCKVPTQPGGSILALHEGTPGSQTHDPRDRLTWRWRKGESTAREELGDPTTSGAFDLCLYQEVAGVSSLLIETHLPPETFWSWTPRGNRYSDRGASNEGVYSVKLNAGEQEKASVLVSAKGMNLDLPPMPLPAGAEVTMQLVGVSACFEGHFGSLKANLPNKLHAVSD
jgi:secreted trypsin-like serine protease